MKKLLLLSALTLGSMCAFAADYTDYFTVSYGGKTLNNNETITCTEYEDDFGKLIYDAEIGVTSLLDVEFPLYGVLSYVNDNEKDLGAPSLCYGGFWEYYDIRAGGYVLSPYGTCFGDKGVCTLYPEVLPITGELCDFEWMAKAINVKPDADLTLNLSFYACNGDEDDYTIIEDTKFSVNILYTTGGAGVEEIGNDSDAAPVYYNLQGVQVNEPANGIYLVKRGNKTTKEFIRK